LSQHSDGPREAVEHRERPQMDEEELEKNLFVGEHRKRGRME
jgi:hypothetical protein